MKIWDRFKYFINSCERIGYNNPYHSTIKIKPIDVNKNSERF